MRLLDRILAESFLSVSDKVNVPYLSGYLGQAQLVLIDNVAAYYRQEIERKKEAKEKIEASDFPNVMLPFEQTFLEMRLNGALRIESIDEAGFLMLMFRASDAEKEFARLRIAVPERRPEEGDPFYDVSAVWYLVSFVFVHSSGKPRVLHAATFVMPVNAEGQILPSRTADVTWIGKCHMVTPDQTVEHQLELLHFMAERFLYPGLLTLSFMHCRNVKVVTERPPEKLSKKYERKTGHPLLKYRLLQIDHMKQVLEREGGATTGGLKKALHICRGHFKHYGRDGKGLLFGKHVATVWIPMHARGSADEGVVVKDYDVK